MSGDDETALALAAENRPDAYEADYMKGEGAVLARHRMVAGRTFNLFMAAVMVAAAMPALALGEFLASGLTAAVLLAAWIGLGVLRVTVSEGAVNVQYGLIGPTIPISSLESVEAIEYNALRLGGGWGYRWTGDGWMYNMMGDGGHAIRMVWRDEDGDRKVTYVGLRDAVACAQNIRVAMEAQSRRLQGRQGPAKALSEPTSD